MTELSINYDEPPWIKVPLQDITTPRPGYICVGPSWWALTPDLCVLFYESYAFPQRSQHEFVTKRLCPGLEAIHIDMSFVPHKCSD